METTSILVVEDDRYIMSLITMFLKDEGYRLIQASSGKEAIALAYANHPDLIILDLGLPDIDGIEVIHSVRVKGDTPIIVVSAREEENDKIQALDCGADDYMTKPFYMGELLARIRVIERKLNAITTQGGGDYFEMEYLTVDFSKGLVFVNEQEVHLTPTEFKLLKLLIANQGKVLTHNYILNHIWGFGDAGDAKSLRVFMASLRRKIELDPSNPRFIITQVGIGYRFVEK